MRLRILVLVLIVISAGAIALYLFSNQETPSSDVSVNDNVVDTTKLYTTVSFSLPYDAALWDITNQDTDFLQLESRDRKTSVAVYAYELDGAEDKTNLYQNEVKQLETIVDGFELVMVDEVTWNNHTFQKFDYKYSSIDDSVSNTKYVLAIQNKVYKIIYNVESGAIAPDYEEFVSEISILQ